MFCVRIRKNRKNHCQLPLFVRRSEVTQMKIRFRENPRYLEEHGVKSNHSSPLDCLQPRTSAEPRNVGAGAFSRGSSSVSAATAAAVDLAACVPLDTYWGMFAHGPGSDKFIFRERICDFQRRKNCVCRSRLLFSQTSC